MKTKSAINNSFSTVLELKQGVPQPSIVGPLFSISIFWICFTSSMRGKLQATQITQHRTDADVTTNINLDIISNSKLGKLLGVTIDESIY